MPVTEHVTVPTHTPPFTTAVSASGTPACPMEEAAGTLGDTPGTPIGKGSEPQPPRLRELALPSQALSQTWESCHQTSKNTTF